MAKDIPVSALALAGARRAALRALPARWQLPARYHLQRVSKRLEPEIFHLRELAGPGLAIDVGANHGIYSYALARLGREVQAFEPQPGCAATLLGWAPSTVHVHQIALSDAGVRLPLKIPVVQGVQFTGYATFDEVNGEYETIDVAVARLDDFRFHDVSFIKIDVEGHEASVLRGGEETIRRCKPVLLIEAAVLHIEVAAIDSLFKQIQGYGYDGFFLLDGSWQPLEAFSVETHQEARIEGKTTAPYVTNFVFRPTG
jgi:FkbM family methyltransferase